VILFTEFQEHFLCDIICLWTTDILQLIKNDEVPIVWLIWYCW